MADEQGLTKEQFIKQYGYDPEPEAVAEAGPSKPPSYGISQIPRDLAVGALTAIPDLYGAIDTVPAAVRGGYNWATGGEGGFGGKVQERILKPDAKDNIQKHIEEQALKWQQSDPTLTQDELNELAGQYQKTRAFEDFTNSQRTHFASTAAEWKAGVRRYFGDTRTEDERSWANDIGEVAGGALLGGPSGLLTKAGATGVGKAITGSVVNNAVTRGGLRVAEALSPVTMPYTPLNVGLNFAVGSTIDTAAKIAQDKPNMITSGLVQPDHEDPAGIGAAAAIATATGATALIASALRGRIKVELPRSIEQALPHTGVPSGMPQPAQGGVVNKVLNELPQPPRGQEGISAGPDIPSEPQPMLPTLKADGGLATRAQNSLVDEFTVARTVLEEIKGPQVAHSMDMMFSDLTGARLIDKSVKEADRLVGRMLEIRNSMTPDAQMKLNTVLHHAGVWGKRMQLDFEIEQEINDLTGRISRTQNQSYIAKMQAELAEKTAERSRLQGDLREHRPWLQDVSAVNADTARLALDNATDPLTIEIRNLLKDAGKKSLELPVKSGKMTQSQADLLHDLNPYFIHMKIDRLEGATGWNRVWLGLKLKAREAFKTDTENAGNVNPTHQSPIYALRDTVPESNAAPRINNALDPLMSLHDYVRQMYIDYGHTTVRNNYLGHVLYNGTQPSALMQGNHAKIWQHPEESGKTWFSAAQVRSDPAIQKAMFEDRYLPRYQGGRMQLVQLGDTDITAALRQYSPTWNTMMKILWTEPARWAKSNTTGMFAPLFAFTNMYMDAVMATFRQSNRSFGSLTTAAFKYLPEPAAKAINAIAIDPTVLVNLHWYMAKGLLNVAAFHMAPRIARTLGQTPGLNAFAAAVGQQNWQSLVRRMLDAASNSHMAYLTDRGAMHSSSFSPGDIGKIQAAVDDFKLTQSLVPPVLRAGFQAFSDVLGAVHSAPKLTFYSQNYSILARKYKGNIPQAEIAKLVDETANLAGDMSRKPGSATMRGVDAGLPYLQQMRAGTYYMLRNMQWDSPNALPVWARLTTLTMGVAQGHLMMLNWDEESKKYWANMPGWDRYRKVAIPTAATALAWARGETVKFSPDKVWFLPLAPDIAPVIAGSVYMLQQMGLVPSDAAPVSLGTEVPKVFFDAMTPMMPPGAQFALGAMGAKLDPQGADVRGGNWLRTSVSAFRKGPGAEAQSNLGEVSQSTAMMLSGLLGANGAYLQTALDVGMHAMKYHPEPNAYGEATQKAKPDFMKGLSAAMSSMGQQVFEPKTDVFPLWQRGEKYYKSTPAWEHATDGKRHIENISGMRDEVGKTSVAGRIGTAEAGGMPAPSLQDQTLISIAQEVYAFNRPNGELGRLKTAYTELAKQQRGFQVQYNKPYKWRREQENNVIRKMQDNMQQQQLAIMWLEGDIADNYGKVLQPVMQGREITVETLEDVMREARGKPAAIQPVDRPNARAPISEPVRAPVR